MKIKNILGNLFSNERRWYEILFHLFFVTLILISAIQYLERTLPFDSAFYCFNMLFEGKFEIESGRWGAVYNQLLPLAGLKMGCSLNTFLKLYSLSFVICNYIFFLIIFYRFKQLYTALAFILVQVVVYRYNFYCPASEIHAVTGPAFLMLAMLSAGDLLQRRKLISTLFIFSLIFWMVNTHLVSICIILFMFGYTFVNDTSYFKRYYLYGALMLGIAAFLYLLKGIEAGSYQDSKMVSIATLKFVITHLREVEGFKYLRLEFKNNYYLPTAILAIVIIYYLVKRNFLKLLVVCGAVGGFFILDMAYNIKYESPFVLSNYYSIFGFFILIPFSYDVIKNLNFKYAFPLVTVIIIISIFKILKCGIFFTEQMDYYKRVTDNLRRYKERKFIVSEYNMDWNKVWIDWDIPFQSLIISSLQHPDSAITFYTPDNMDAWAEKSFKDTITFLGPDFSRYGTTKNFPKKYFNLRNTVYRKVTSYQDSTFDPGPFNKTTLMLEFGKPEYDLVQTWHRTLPITVSNKTDKNFPCIVTRHNRFHIGYKIIDAETGKSVFGGRSLLEMDVPPHKKIISGLVIDLHTIKKGNYFLEADFVFERKYWLYNPKRVKLKVY